MTISFGKNPLPPDARSWANRSGVSWAYWLDQSDHILDQTPELGREYKLRLPANFIATDFNNVTFQWLPADSAQNGFDDGNISELAELRFATGRIRPIDGSEQALLFTPELIESPQDMLEQESKPVTELNTLMGGQRHDYEFERFVCVEFDFEGDVSSQYIFLDSQLIMLEDHVWHDAHFWIGNASLSPQLTRKIVSVDK